MTAAPTFTIGSIVQARGRDWVVVPGADDPDVIYLRPLGGNDDDVTGILPAVEEVVSSQFALPDPDDVGDHESARLLRDAVRLNIRAGAGPFRSFGRVAVEPRPYQLVPLLMALRLDPVRLMIADDVGIGKTIEAGLIARELLDRNEIRRIAVVCPAHLCDQWQAELKAKFDLDAEIVRPGTIARLQRPLSAAQSVFEEYPVVIVSIDYIKNQRRRDEFLRACAEFVIIDEAHTCAASGSIGGAQQQRHELLQALVNGTTNSSKRRHLILVTATPHSGDEQAFRSLLGLLDRDFPGMPDPDVITADDPLRQRLALHLVQRQRRDIEAYLDEKTPFPDRIADEVTWRMSRDGASLFEDVLAFARDQVTGSQSLGRNQQRVSWWAALALMRSAVSSPAAMAAALRTRAAGIATVDGTATVTDDVAAVDEQGARSVMDVDALDGGDPDDVVPGADATEMRPTDAQRRRLRDLISRADELSGKKDTKLQELSASVAKLLTDGYRPIIFCRYITTAEYVGEHLAKQLRRSGVTVEVVTGRLTTEDRRQRVQDLGQHLSRLLVATDCLSEGVNLQDLFDAVIHYDLAWNPTRHEQRIGRVDRFGQERASVRNVMLYGADNPVDGAVMDVLIRKAETIRQALGVAVSVPQRSGAILESVFQAIFDSKGNARQLTLDLGDARSGDLAQREAALDAEWAGIQRRSSSIFNQRSIHPDVVRDEMQQVRDSLGSTAVVERFVRTLANRLNTPLEPRGDTFRLPLNGLPPRIRGQLADRDTGSPVPVDFSFPVSDGAYHLSRTSDVVEAMAAIAIDGALDPNLSPRPARRSGVIITDAVTIETTLAVARLRVHLRTATVAGAREMLAEESLLLAWRWNDGALRLLPDDEVTGLLDATPTASITDAHRRRAISRAIQEEPDWRPLVDQTAYARAASVLAAHRRVRDVVELRGAGRLMADPMLPVDILGLFVFLPA